MKLSQANRYFNTVHIEGWDGATWQPLFLYGDLLAYDRFIGPRTFGHKQRVLLLGGDDMIPAGIDFIRLPTGVRYILLSYNQDVDGTGLLSTSYILQEAQYTAEILRYIETPAPSGIGGSITTSVIATVFCDLERYSSSASPQMESVRYAEYTIIVPAALALTQDDDVRVDGQVYQVREINPMLHQKELRCVKRGAAA